MRLVICALVVMLVLCCISFSGLADIIAGWFVDMPLEEGVEIAHRGEQFKDGLPEPLQEDAIIQQEGVVFLDVPEESVALPNIGQRVQPAGPPEREARDEICFAHY